MNLEQYHVFINEQREFLRIISNLILEKLGIITFGMEGLEVLAGFYQKWKNTFYI